jgi:hypothetical protein
MSASIQVRHGDLYKTTRRISLFPVGKQTPVASTEMRGGRSTCFGGDAFSDCNGSSAFFCWFVIDSIKVVIWNIEALMWF